MPFFFAPHLNRNISRFPPSSPLKPLPSTPSGKKNFSLKDKEGLFKFRSSKKLDKETLVSSGEVYLC